MTSTTVIEHIPSSAATPASLPLRFRRAVSDGLTMAARDLARLRHTPGLAVVSLLAPAGFLVIFAYLFGSAISLPGSGVSAEAYRNFLVPGIFATVAVTAMVATAGTVAEDSLRGVYERLRSMPCARYSLAFGRTASDFVVALFAMAVMAGCGLAVGWRARDGLGPALEAFGVLLLFGYALSWVGVSVGLALRSRDMVQQVGALLFGLPFYSAAFVPTGGMPFVLRDIAEWNPVSAVVVYCRGRFGNPGATIPGGAWPLQHPGTAAVGYSLLLLVLFVPLTVRKIGRRL
jgi:ABC-2 type transport system permease protein